jgi:hypothetical protein
MTEDLTDERFRNAYLPDYIQSAATLGYALSLPQIPLNQSQLWSRRLGSASICPSMRVVSSTPSMIFCVVPGEKTCHGGYR